MNSLVNYCATEKLFRKKNEFNEWINIIRPILATPEFQKRRYFKHHETQTVYDHCIMVSAISFKLAKKYRVDVKNCAIAGMLHDFYTCAWQYSKELELLDEKYRTNFLPDRKHQNLFKLHGFIHGMVAEENALIYFPDLVNKKILNAIATHMFPLSLCTKCKFPKYKESWVIMISDKIATTKDMPSLLQAFKYIGFRRRKVRN